MCPPGDMWQCLEIMVAGTTWNGGHHQSSAERSASKFSLCIEETLTTKKVSVLKVSAIEA